LVLNFCNLTAVARYQRAVTTSAGMRGVLHP
jgi:hypothetical protein